MVKQPFFGSLPFDARELDPNLADSFRELYELANKLINTADKNVMSEVARGLAVDVAYYRMKYGATPVQETRAALEAQAISDEHMAQLADAMAYLITVIGMTTSNGDNASDVTPHC